MLNLEKYSYYFLLEIIFNCRIISLYIKILNNIPVDELTKVLAFHVTLIMKKE
jgi:hypothetical protein